MSPKRHLASISTTGAIGSGLGQAGANVHISVSGDGTMTIEGSRRASLNEEIVAELDVHQRRALRDALDATL